MPLGNCLSSPCFPILPPHLIIDLICSPHKPEYSGIPPNPGLPTTSVLLIDGIDADRTYWADQLRRYPSDYEIVEAPDGQSGLALYRSRRIDCVVLELSLPDLSGFETLVELVPLASRPQIAVIILALMKQRGVWELARRTGAYTCLAKKFTSGEGLDKTIQRAVAFVGRIPKEDRYRQ